ncbi:MAG: DUF4062 domain-containing protein, partial [Pseudomonadales bacterium]|nr:DUF4062 domain-containing protein [Pseudomonadales bacterium]
MSAKFYQVFVSATYLDLVEERRVLLEILPQLNCLPVLLPSQGPDAWPSVRRRIESCDYFILLLGSRYGSLTPSGVSHTHQEYVHASFKQKPRLIFMHAQPEQRPRSLQDDSAEGRLKFQDFRQLLKQGECCLWTQIDDLAQALHTNVPRLMQSYPMPGWVSGAAVSSSEQDTVVARLQGRVAELEAEKEAWLQSGVRLDELAQGQDRTEIHYLANVYAGGHCELLPLISSMTWNDVFLAIASGLREPQPERYLHERLAEMLRTRGLADARQLRPKAHALTDVRLT